MEGVDAMVAFGGGVAVAALLQVGKLWIDNLPLSDKLRDAVIPTLALVFGVLWNWLILNYLRAEDQRAVTIVLAGLMSGFIASGIWSQASAAVRSFEKQDEPGASVPHG